jgi:hypothetical protein
MSPSNEDKLISAICIVLAKIASLVGVAEEQLKKEH